GARAVLATALQRELVARARASTHRARRARAPSAPRSNLRSGRSAGALRLRARTTSLPPRRPGRAFAPAPFARIAHDPVRALAGACTWFSRPAPPLFGGDGRVTSAREARPQPSRPLTPTPDSCYASSRLYSL